MKISPSLSAEVITRSSAYPRDRASVLKPASPQRCSKPQKHVFSVTINRSETFGCVSPVKVALVSPTPAASRVENLPFAPAPRTDARTHLSPASSQTCERVFRVDCSRSLHEFLAAKPPRGDAPLCWQHAGVRDRYSDRQFPTRKASGKQRPRESYAFPQELSEQVYPHGKSSSSAS